MAGRKNSIWPIISDAVGMVERNEVGVADMLGGLLFSAVYFAFRSGIGRADLEKMLAGKWEHMERSDKRRKRGSAIRRPTK